MFAIPAPTQHYISEQRRQSPIIASLPNVQFPCIAALSPDKSDLYLDGCLILMFKCQYSRNLQTPARPALPVGLSSKPSPLDPASGIAGLGHSASIPRARGNASLRDIFLLLIGGARALPWHPQQEQNRHPPIFARCARCQTGRSPLPIFFLLPLTRSRRRAGVHARTLRRTP